MSQETNVLQNGYEMQEYCIESVLGTGGFGITYKARDTHLDTLVAIKEYFPVEWAYRGHDGVSVHSNSQGQAIIPEVQTSGYEWGLDRFLEEARVLARVQHPFVVRVRRYFRENGTAYIVMDYEAGEPVSALLKRQGSLSESELRSMLEQVLPALEAVHREGYLHRDLKPSNLYIRARDNCIMLIDFGAARQSLIQRSKSVTGLVTPGYSPPEQYVTRSDRYGPWTDIYALGAVMYRCITGKPPTEAPDRQMWDTMLPAAEVGAGRYHVGLLAVVDKALAMRPEDRFQSVAEMQAALKEFAGLVIRPPLAVYGNTVMALEAGMDQARSKLAETGDSLPSAVADVPVGADNLTQADIASELFQSEALVASLKSGAARPAERMTSPPLKELAPATELARTNPNPRLIRTPVLITSPSTEPEAPSSHKLSPRTRDFMLLLVLVVLVFILTGVALNVYENYQSRIDLLSQQQQAEENAAAHEAAREKAQRNEEESRRQEVTRYVEQARAAMNARDWSRAVEYLDRAEALQPGNARVAIVRGELTDAQRVAPVAVEIWTEPRINLKLVRIRGSCFTMGSTETQAEYYMNEKPHQVCVKNFWISQHEVTNAQYRLFQPNHSSGTYKGLTLDDPEQPVADVSWNDATAYAQWLSQQTRRRYRLPTEAEWEFAARAGTTASRFWGNEPTEACNYANVADRMAQRQWGASAIHECYDGQGVAAPIGSYSSNPFRLYDMLGNVSEWTCSEYQNEYNVEETRCSRQGPHSGRRAVRGGSWDDSPRLVRAANRNDREPDTRDYDLGFRLVLEE